MSNGTKKQPRIARAARFNDREWQEVEALRRYKGQVSLSATLRSLAHNAYIKLPEEAK